MARQQDEDRQKRSYPHGSGDRNAWSPFGKERMPIHEGGTQRKEIGAPRPPERKPRRDAQ